MKKYIIPKATCINIAGEETLLLSGSLLGQEDTEVVMTREQNTNSPWDNWNE